jgi:hypothetical protein
MKPRQGFCAEWVQHCIFVAIDNLFHPVVMVRLYVFSLGPGTIGKNEGGRKKKYSLRFMDARRFICFSKTSFSVYGQVRLELSHQAGEEKSAI